MARIRKNTRLNRDRYYERVETYERLRRLEEEAEEAYFDLDEEDLIPKEAKLTKQQFIKRFLKDQERKKNGERTDPGAGS